jgi:hypothetical protein
MSRVKLVAKYNVVEDWKGFNDAQAGNIEALRTSLIRDPSTKSKNRRNMHGE